MVPGYGYDVADAFLGANTCRVANEHPNNCQRQLSTSETAINEVRNNYQRGPKQLSTPETRW